MRILAICPSCQHRRLFLKRWYYHHFMAGTIHDKAENEKCLSCARTLQDALNKMKP